MLKYFVLHLKKFDLIHNIVRAENIVIIIIFLW